MIARRPMALRPARPVRTTGTARRILALVVVGGTAVAVAAGCSSSTPSASRSSGGTGYQGRAVTKAAEPGNAPEPSRPPAGKVFALPAGSLPWGVAVAHSVGYVYVALRDPDRLAVYDMRAATVRIVPAPGAARMMDLKSPTELLFPAEKSNTLFTLALPSLKVIGSEQTKKQPHQAVQVGDTTFVTEEFGHGVRAFRAGRAVANFDQPVQPGGLTAVGDRLAVVDVATNTLFVYDAKTLKLVAALPAGAGPAHVVPVGGTRVAVGDVRGDAILTYDIGGTPRALGRLAVPGRPFWVKDGSEPGTVFATLANTNLVAKVHVDSDGTPTLVATVPTVRQANTIDVDPVTGTVYLAGYSSAQLEVIPASAFGQQSQVPAGRVTAGG